MKELTIGTRGSKLALWQAKFLKNELLSIGVEANLEIIKTKGDKIQHLGFDKLEGKGFFTKELEDALLRGEIDVAVHSMKDLPTEMPKDLVIAGVSYRERPEDVLLIHPKAIDEQQPLSLKENAIVGTSSARRKAQLFNFRKDIELKDIRGNVPTRINKINSEDFDAIVLAAAGVSRLELDLSDFKVIYLNPKEFIPAPAQGVLAYQTCDFNLPIRRLFKKIHKTEVAACTNVERKVMKLLGGGCHMPLGVYCYKDTHNNFHVYAANANDWNKPLKEVRLSSSTSYGLAESIVERLKA